MKRIEFKITEDLYRKMEELKERMGAYSMAEVFRRLVEEAWRKRK